METQIRAAWPSPPLYYKESATLDPPPIPADPELRVYGVPIHETFQTQFTALESEIQLLYDPANLDLKAELKKLNISLLFVFMELLEVLISDPSGHTEGTEKIEKIFINIHHLLNTYRPHQARETVISILEKQIQRRQEFLEDLEKKIGIATNNLKVAKVNINKVDLTKV